MGAWLLVAAVLLFIVVVPLFWIFVASVHADADNRLTLANYVEAFTKPIYLRPIENSFLLAGSVAVVAVIVGTGMAWATSRTDIPGREVLRLLVFAAFVTPSFPGATAWIFLAAPHSGWLNRAWVALTGAPRGPFNIYSLGGAVFVIALYSYPYAFAFVNNALEMVPSEMERSAALLGAGWARTTWRITLPLVRPAILAGALMSFLEALAEFGTPAFLLIPARQQVMTTQLYLFFQYPTRPNLAAAYAVPLLAVTAGLFLLRAAPPALSLVLPYVALVATSLSRTWGRGPVPGNLTLQWYRWALVDNLAARQAIQHSVTYAAAAATIATVLAVVTAYTSSRRLLPGAWVLGYVAMAPFVVPGIVLAIGFFAAYARPPIVLYGTGWMLVVAFATRFLPVAYAGSEAALRGIDVDLEHAARTLGCGQLRTFRRITLPLLRRSVLASWLMTFIPSLRELSSAVFLFTPATAVMTTLIFDLSDYGNYEPVSTLGIIMMALTFGLVALAYRLFGSTVLVRRSST